MKLNVQDELLSQCMHGLISASIIELMVWSVIMQCTVNKNTWSVIYAWFYLQKSIKLLIGLRCTSDHNGLLIVNIESLKHTLHSECINKQHALKWKHHIRMCLYVSARSDLSTAHNQHRCMIWSLDIAYKMHNLIYEQTDSKQAITETSYNALIIITARNRTRQLISLYTHLWKLLTLFISWNH